MRYLLALDQGTSSSRAIVFDLQGRIVDSAQREFRQHYPQPGRVEHDPDEIWSSQLTVAQEVLTRVPVRDIAAVGITNQRETTLVWNRHTGQPVYPAIVWQDRRGEPLCAQWRAEGRADDIRQRTGLVVDAYFSATKIHWILENVPGARVAAENGDLLFGTVDTWLIWKLSGGRLHVTDVTNASRTMLYHIGEQRWDPTLLGLLGIPPSMLPTVHPSSHAFGEIDAAHLGAPLLIGGIAGDQQSALFGQTCFEAGMAKNTYGTGCFLLMHTGERLQHSANGLLTTAAAQVDHRPQYALEGSVFIAGAVVQWLRDNLRAFERSADVEKLAASVPDSGGVVVVPSFTGLGAPYWRAETDGAMFGLTRGTTMAHIARAALESIAFQSAALLVAMRKDAGQDLAGLRVDGGAAANDMLMQFQADLLGVPVVRPKMLETTALGAACLAGLTAGLYDSCADITRNWQIERTFEPSITRDEAAARMAHWERAVAAVPDRLT